jgi:hypothetical protein
MPTRRSIQRRATCFFEFGLPFPPWMSYAFATNQKMKTSQHSHLNGKTIEFDLSDFQPRKLRHGVLQVINDKVILMADEFVWPQGKVYQRTLSESEIAMITENKKEGFDFLLEVHQ